HHARFEFVYRSFAKTLIHEHIFTYSGQHHTHSPIGSDIPSFQFTNRLAEFLSDGWPTPDEGGAITLLEKRSIRETYSVLIFCDDLFLCPTCGEFHQPTEDLTMFPWVSDESDIDHEIIQRTISERRAVAEFSFRECESADCAAYRARVIEQMKQERSARIRTAAFNVELAKAAGTSINSFPPARLPKKAFVYAISSGEHVKIGLATNVKHRVLGLQTSSPLPLSVINAWEHDNAPKMERLLHRKYGEFRTSGEWFRLNPALLQELQSANQIEDLLG
ncbi:MAG: GIY-YIG nuclease family protein, partial [Chthoniobacteraceae bacterium]